TEPTALCEMHRRVGDQVYLVLPAEAHAWAREHGIPLLPASQAEVSGDSVHLSLTGPDAGAVYKLDPATSPSRQRIRVSAAADVPLETVTLSVDGAPLAEFQAPPYEVTWQLAVGEHSFQAHGLDAAGEETVSGIVWITVKP
ncbi:MAG: hypothetical protein MUQ10_14685, partial [Anaerolineae bacterium]|nr:hypothetical protein [Anaerolineae bacterium]